MWMAVLTPRGSAVRHVWRQRECSVAVQVGLCGEGFRGHVLRELGSPGTCVWSSAILTGSLHPLLHADQLGGVMCYRWTA